MESCGPSYGSHTFSDVTFFQLRGLSFKFRRSLLRRAPYPGALALNFRRSVPGKLPYSGAWPLNFRGCCPGSHPKWSLILGPNIFLSRLARGVARGGDMRILLLLPWLQSRYRARYFKVIYNR